MGHSFGGILVQEIAQHIHPDGLVLVSTICGQAELPPTLSVLRKIPAHLLWRRPLVKGSYILWGEKDGYNTADQRSEFYDMTDTHSDYYYRWAVQRVINWSGDLPRVAPLLRIHGDADNVFPIRYLRDDSVHVVAGGSHIMIKSQADLISSQVRAFINVLSE
jgi:hypothetical protein